MPQILHDRPMHENSTSNAIKRIPTNSHQTSIIIRPPAGNGSKVVGFPSIYANSPDLASSYNNNNNNNNNGSVRRRERIRPKSQIEFSTTASPPTTTNTTQISRKAIIAAAAAGGRSAAQFSNFGGSPALAAAAEEQYSASTGAPPGSSSSSRHHIHHQPARQPPPPYTNISIVLRNQNQQQHRSNTSYNRNRNATRYYRRSAVINRSVLQQHTEGGGNPFFSDDQCYGRKQQSVITTITHNTSQMTGFPQQRHVPPADHHSSNNGGSASETSQSSAGSSRFSDTSSSSDHPPQVPSSPAAEEPENVIIQQPEYGVYSVRKSQLISNSKGILNGPPPRSLVTTEQGAGKKWLSAAMFNDDPPIRAGTQTDHQKCINSRSVDNLDSWHNMMTSFDSSGNIHPNNNKNTGSLKQNHDAEHGFLVITNLPDKSADQTTKGFPSSVTAASQPSRLNGSEIAAVPYAEFKSVNKETNSDSNNQNGIRKQQHRPPPPPYIRLYRNNENGGGLTMNGGNDHGNNHGPSAASGRSEQNRTINNETNRLQQRHQRPYLSSETTTTTTTAATLAVGSMETTFGPSASSGPVVVTTSKLLGVVEDDSINEHSFELHHHPYSHPHPHPSSNKPSDGTVVHSGSGTGSRMFSQNRSISTSSSSTGYPHHHHHHHHINSNNDTNKHHYDGNIDSNITKNTTNNNNNNAPGLILGNNNNNNRLATTSINGFHQHTYSSSSPTSRIIATTNGMLTRRDGDHSDINGGNGSGGGGRGGVTVTSGNGHNHHQLPLLSNGHNFPPAAITTTSAATVSSSSSPSASASVSNSSSVVVNKNAPSSSINTSTTIISATKTTTARGGEQQQQHQQQLLLQSPSSSSSSSSMPNNNNNDSKSSPIKLNGADNVDNFGGGTMPNNRIIPNGFQHNSSTSNSNIDNNIIGRQRAFSSTFAPSGGADEGLVLIRIRPDAQGRFGFNVKGGSDQNYPIIVSRVAPSSPADQCYPRLNEGDQVLRINQRDVADLTHDQVVRFIRSAREPPAKELQLTVRPNVYMGEDIEEPDFQYVPESSRCSVNVPRSDLLSQSILLLRDSLSSGAGISQFEQLYRKKPGMTMDICKLPENLSKNRYRDILPYDSTRVTIRESPSGNYINSNFMEVPASGIVNRYIAGQGPLPHTTADFWAVVWEQLCTTVVMLTATVERGRVKCHQYWPRLYESQDLGQLQVTCLREKESPSTATREFSIIHKETKEERLVTQMQYQAWPDHGVPQNHNEFVDFVQEVRSQRVGCMEPIIVHCSAGIGRTGVLILMETAMCLIEANEPVYPLDIVRTMRDQRPMLIQTSSQYKFVCDAIVKAYKDGFVKPLPEYS